MHLTNNSVQSKNNDTVNPNNLMWSQPEFALWLNTTQKSKPQSNIGVDVWKDVIFPQICRLCACTVNSVSKDLQCISTVSDFELFGYDFMIDSNYVVSVKASFVVVLLGCWVAGLYSHFL